MTMQWQQVRALVEAGRLEQLTRSDAVTQRYREHKQKCDVNQHILGNLHWTASELQHWRDQTGALFSAPSLYRVSTNDFPYDFEPGIHHLVIWSKIYIPLYNDKNEKNIQLEQKIDRFIHEHMVKFGLTTDDYIWFMNTIALQSVHSISHLHLIVRSDQDLADKILHHF